MHSKKIIVVLSVAFVLTAFLSACAAQPTVDPMLQITQIAGTIQADLTKAAELTPSVTPTLEPTATATLAPATETPSGAPTNTPYPTTNPSAKANDSQFVTDVTIPDGTTFAHTEAFVKTWRFKNTGQSTWTTLYRLVYVEGNLLGAEGAYSVFLPKDVAPGETVDISINFKTPDALGTYQSYWRLYTNDNVPFGAYCSILINSGARAGTAAPTATATKSGG
jgi:hypothetical protein